MSLKDLAVKRASLGAVKYAVDNPNPEGPWGEAPKVEQFWFRDLPQDLREELADAAVYLDKLLARASRDQRLVSDMHYIRSSVNEALDVLEDLYRFSLELTGLFLLAAPELLEDRKDVLGEHFSRAVLI